MQARALGANMIHSPVVDVNTNPKNPEIGTRAYSDNQDQVIKYALESLKGFKDTGLIATAKHFPGRGESETDAHWDLPSVNVDKETMYRVHLAPYKTLIEAGVPAIMTAQCSYPAFGVHDIPASTSAILIKDLLREELGFKGVITTDNMMMGGILQRFEIREAVVRTIEAGNDLVLYRDESAQRPRIIEAVISAIKNGRIPEKQIDESVERILKMRLKMGLDKNGGKVNSNNAGQPINDPFVIKTAREAAEKSVLLLRDKANILPLKKDQKILLVEQIFSTHQMANNMACHPGMLWEEMNLESPNVGSVEIPNLPTKHDWERVLKRVDEADIIVSTNYYYHKAAASNSDLIREIQKTGKPVVVISNSPYEKAAPDDLPTIITIFTAGGRENLRAAVRVLYGKHKSTAKIPVQLM
jgi:beta-N-acetylhexosaminidase